jgi:hypothetical protein
VFDQSLFSLRPEMPKARSEGCQMTGEKDCYVDAAKVGCRYDDDSGYGGGCL